MPCPHAVALPPCRRRSAPTASLNHMATETIHTLEYMLYPSPRNEHRVIFEHQSFVPHMYTLIHLPDYGFRGKATLFSAQRKSDGKQGHLVTCELAEDLARFERLFEPD